MAYHPSGFCDRSRQVAAFLVSIGLAASCFVVPWFASTANASTPVVTNYTGTGISDPDGITAGPDGALWFTNNGTAAPSGASPREEWSPSTPETPRRPGCKGSPPARTAPYGLPTETTPSGASRREGQSPTITARASEIRKGSPPARTAPCGSPTSVTPCRRSLHRVDRAHHDGRGRHQLHRNGHQRSGGDRHWPGRRFVVHQRKAPSGASRRQGSSPTTPERASALRSGSPSARTAPCGSPTTETAPSAASRRGGSSPTTPERASAIRKGSPPARTTPCGSPTRKQLHRAHHDGWGRDQLHRNGHQRSARDRRRPGRGIVVHQLRKRLHRAHHHRVQPPPTTSILIPSNGAKLSGRPPSMLPPQTPPASSSGFSAASYGYNAPVLCAAKLTYYGWVCNWDTTTVPNGSYTLLSEAFGAGGSTFSSGVSITVEQSTADDEHSPPFKWGDAVWIDHPRCFRLKRHQRRVPALRRLLRL